MTVEIDYVNTTELSANEELMVEELTKVFTEITQLLITKGRYYGHEGIKLTGEGGIVVRLVDKIFRLKNIVIDNPNTADPEDTWLDTLGYSLLGVLMHRRYFEKEEK